MTSKKNGFMADLSSEAQRARAKKNRNSTPWRCGPHCSTTRAHKMFQENNVKPERKPVVRHWKPEYRIDAEGGIVYGLRGRPLVRTTSNGYIIVVRHGKYVNTAHRMIWEHVNGPIPSGMQINHKNGVRHDNRIVNLELVTASQNVKHSYSHGSSCAKGERNNQSKLTEEEAIAIRNSQSGTSTLAAAYGVHRNTVQRIRSGKLWAHLAQSGESP